ncbi:TPA: ATP-dependent helicase HrpB [Pseudomonas aeruginosa]|uniref:ATP-dependent helicase HrpB n=1 Tax=Pseudomonas aeruginosa TaxID=287 RepID=UPI000F835CB3|nr:ATP-dependent helicase HrpB [Pseudomonas aeruginosa]MDV6570083.1 ATP-dependent helicase HrpB [Pseudomonas aeruginosa]MDX4010094.1 ATP-dependent helicase HrpB [Pseudomonas aeruginosa]RTX47851.1 ATP-dependent helicase HrpB [Pseudomonas aeruginosa]HCF9826541.1 ATP-dependent helicase HrpB [Pseudomonas aeruginosa]HEQ0116306.1 ATP-dependent helicase HrpB [Pseudomonas aeruginosa]
MIQLPIDAAIPSLRLALAEHESVVLQAPPGAGKTTRVPLVLLNEAWLADQSIVMLQPRRVAARAAAERMASELGEKVGETVGYRIRLESRVGPSTRIEVVTEGILSRRLQDDPSLEGVGLVIFDEFHLRSLDSDLALALCLNGRELFRDDRPLKLLVMSATLEGARLSNLLGDAPVVTSEGRMFPVNTVWGQPYQAGEYIEPTVVRTCLDVVHDQQGSVLIFLPGQAEIRRVHQELSDKLAGRDDLLLCVLHGELDLSAQRAAIEPAPPGKRKIVLATNIAETSLTIEGVRVVIDSGLERVPRFDPSSGMTRLATQRISQASAAQRAGRAGRLEPGICYRLWSQTQYEQMAAYGAPEIHQADLAALALQLARWGVTPDQLRWLDVPPAAPFGQARELLGRLGALEADGRLSSHGQAMAEVPAHPRIAHLLLRGHALGLGALACDVAALLGERDVLPGGGADLHSRLAILEGSQRMPRHAQGGAQRIKQLARQYRSYQRGIVTEAVADPEHPRWLGCLLALAYPDRVAQQRRAGGGEYRLANGRAAMFTEPDALMKHSWLVVAELGSRQGQREERIYLATDLDPALFENVLAEQVTVVDELDWDERAGALVAERQRKMGELVLSREPLKVLDADARSRALLGLVRKKGLELLPWTPELRQWQARVALLRELDLAQQGQSKWPCFRDDTLLATMEEWLLPYLNNVSRLSHFSLLDLSSILRGALPWPLPQELDELAPTHIKVPSGSSIKLDYSESPPVLAVRLQEMFGLADTPRIAGGKLPIKLHLLSPARRPVQVTQDLANFWRSTYAEVRKDLKGRYPKHYWPDDPLVAEATARAKPRK